MNSLPQYIGFTPFIRANGGTFRRAHFQVHRRGVFQTCTAAHGIGLVSADSGRIASSQCHDFQQRWLCSLASIVVFFFLQISVASLRLPRGRHAGLSLAYAAAQGISFAKECRQAWVALVSGDALRRRLWLLFCCLLSQWSRLQTASLIGLVRHAMLGKDSAPAEQGRELIARCTKKTDAIPNGCVSVPGKRDIQMQNVPPQVPQNHFEKAMQKKDLWGGDNVFQ